jgi:hypothetical protein
MLQLAAAAAVACVVDARWFDAIGAVLAPREDTSACESTVVFQFDIDNVTRCCARNEDSQSLATAHAVASYGE